MTEPLRFDATIEDDYPIFNNPVYKWCLKITDELHIHHQKAPNLLHRFAQRLVFGFKWEIIYDHPNQRRG